MCVRVKKWREDAQPQSRSDAPPDGRPGVGFPSPLVTTEPQAVSESAGSGPVGGPGNSRPVPRQRGAAAPPRPEETSGTRETGISFGVPHQRPWENAVEAGHTHDPHEVTVQLDGAGRQFEEHLVQQAKEGQSGVGVGDGPVFVDETGRRSRRYRRVGIAVGGACAVYAVVIVATLLSGNSNAPWLPVPGQQDEQPAGQVETSPLPAESVEPSGSTEVAPAPQVPVSAGGTPSSKGAAPAVTPGASPTAGAAKPDASVEPKPSAGASKPHPGTTTSPEPDPEPSVSVSGSPSPTPPETSAPPPDPSPSPTTSPAADGGTVADGPSDPTPIAESPADPGATLAAGDPAPSSEPATLTA